MELRGERVVLRPLAEADVPRLAEIATEPEVVRWWGEQSAEDLGKKARGEEPDETFFTIFAEGEPAGLIQYYEENERDFRHAGIDVFLSAVFQGRGLGADAVRAVARHLIEDRRHHRLTIDPAADNAYAIRCYEKVGFRRVGVMREYWRAPDGVWRDGLLLDLLAKELT